MPHFDLHLAWNRLKKDRPGRVFVEYPNVVDWIERDVSNWLDVIDARLDTSYDAADCEICDVPKGGPLVRPGSVLQLSDELVFNAILGDMYGQIWQALGWSQGDPDIAYQIQSPPAGPEWINSGFKVWDEWRKKSLQKASRGAQFVAFADIAAFYENIDLRRLMSDLGELHVDSDAHTLLNRCLQRWAQPRGKGIPQGYSASDILAKVYMDKVDRGLKNTGFTHLRYVDDIRIFCRSHLEAKRALLKLNELLRTRGLNLQTAKTEILRLEEARSKIDGVATLIQSIQVELKQELHEAYDLLGDYPSLDDIEEAAESSPESAPPEVLEAAFRDNFSLASDTEFNKTLFHFLLNRLGRTKSASAVPYCLELLARHPEETESVLRYLGTLGQVEEHSEAILDYAESPEAIYHYQLYEIVRWFYEEGVFPEKLLTLCRRWMFDRNRPIWLRSYALAIISKAGDSSDFEHVESNYAQATGEMERAQIAAALRGMERSRRNEFYGRIRSDGDLVHRAISWARSH